jgi:5'/3'-nucleotidase
MSKPLVLLSNDDGFRARGLALVKEALADFADIVVCAPDYEQSAASHALSLHRPLRLFSHGDGVFSIDGTPADCVYVALHAGSRVVPRRPDLVVSGLNHGLNLGDDVFYSGTVAAAREGSLKGIPSLAVSGAPDTDQRAAAAVAVELARALLDEGGQPLLLNVNFPGGSSWPMRATRLGSRVYKESIEFRRDPRGREYLWIGGQGVEHRMIAGSDTEAFDDGAVGVTALVLDLWNRDDHSRADSIVGRALSSGSRGK